jgi:EAL domain-containing protein (putative c-di-GMP-specific phosphodiesterase class I)
MSGQVAAVVDSADAIQLLTERFSVMQAAALFVVRMPLLTEIERNYGPVAFDKVTKAFTQAVNRFAEGRFAREEYIVAAAPHGEEVILIVTRPRTNSAFYGTQVPAVTTELSQHLEGQRSRVLYPYSSERATFHVGYVVTLYNPSVRPDRQIAVALDNARDDAELAARLRRRQIGHHFLGVVLEEQVSCVYQPIVSLQNGKVLGYEALARGPQGTDWQSPLVLFKLAEDHGLTYELDCLCRRSALRGAAGWTDPNLMLFLNCLPSSIHDPSLSEERLRQTLESSGLTPSNLVLEVSERESIKNFSIFREARERYRNLGIKVALDDTGAGYAGLEAVMELAPDFIKIDISLVRSVDTDTGRRMLLAALQDISEVIGAKLIAEGIETQAELETLHKMQIPYGQGYLLGRPAPWRQARSSPGMA